MTDPFEYDIFISFSSADEEIVKPIWQELCSNGLRVFWSDSSLKKEVGNSWFEAIEKSLERSRHMLLVCSDNSMNSKWVQREYRAFFDYCYSPNSRRLIPLLTREFSPNNLPLFLRQLQVGRINDPGFIQEIIPILGGVNIEKLQHEIQSLMEEVNLLKIENESLSAHSRTDANKISTLAQENTEAKEQIAKLSIENASLKEQVTKLTSVKKTKKQTETTRERAIKPAKDIGVVLPIKGPLTRFIKIANQETLNESGGEYLERGSEFLKKSEFDNAILEFVKVFRRSSPQEKIYQSAKEQLRTLGFSDEDMDFG